jgi:hypothetical protein
MSKRRMLVMALVVVVMLLAAVSVASAQDGSGGVIPTGSPRISYLTYADECNGLIIANLIQDKILGEAPGEDSTDAGDDAPNLVVGRVLPFEDLPDQCAIPGTVSTQ